MEGKSDTGGGVKSPLLGSGGRSRRLSRRNSYNSLRNDFVSRLPDNVRAGLDPESPEGIDYSRTTGLKRGISLPKTLFGNSENVGKCLWFCKSFNAWATSVFYFSFLFFWMQDYYV